MLNRLLIIGLALSFQIRAAAQMERTVYQVFEVDSAKTVTLDIVGFTYPELHVWAGNSILTEANIQVWEASPEIVNFLIEQGRYAFEKEIEGDVLRIFTKIRKREDIKLPGMHTKCVEQTTVKVFIPDIYEWDPADWAPDQTDKPKVLRRKVE
ncbi:MAG: hypothetical protein H6574_20235 [Lewinellaceae bacterium]|nr:hypothetical protein [Saprospiraceae bacterium]MCB9317527.1 hypothetical protein [Lewinellaceae bacterium]MCB9333394.1 hypothetical protein [Lewinellaceae bacterium]